LLQSEKVKKYMDDVCAQVRWKQAHDVIKADLAAHIEDQAEAYENQGMAQDTALSAAITEMGDPVSTGAMLDASYRPASTILPLVPLCVLVFMGLLCQITVYGLTFDYVLALMLGSGCFALLYNINLHRFTRFAPYVYGAMIFILFAMSGHFPYNPRKATVAAALLCTIPALLSCLIYRLRDTGIKGLLICGAATAVPLLICTMLPGYSSVAMVGIACLVLITFAIFKGTFGCKKWLALLITYGGVALAFFLIIRLNPYILNRIYSTTIAPETDSMGYGWFTLRLKEVLAHLRPFGASSFTPDYPLEAPFFVNDYLLAALMQQYGYVPASALILAPLAFAGIGFYKTARLKSLSGQLIAFGIVSVFTMQTVFYVISNLGFFVGIPMPLPFIANGNTALVANFALMGLLFSLFRCDQLDTEKSTPLPRLKIRFEWV